MIVYVLNSIFFFFYYFKYMMYLRCLSHVKLFFNEEFKFIVKFKFQSLSRNIASSTLSSCHLLYTIFNILYIFYLVYIYLDSTKFYKEGKLYSFYQIKNKTKFSYTLYIEIIISKQCIYRYERRRTFFLYL